MGALLDAGVDAVAISTPPQTRRELVLEAIGRGSHVVADKPFAPTAAAAEELVQAADAAGVLLSVFHNRRWDTDITTLRGVLDGGLLGDIWRFDSRFDLDQPQTLEAGPEGGLLRDLGSHLVDQALWLLGPARAVTANLDWLELPEGRTDAGFVITIAHASGAHSHVSASKVNRTESRELRVFGSLGSYVSSQTDVQAQAIFAGVRPVDDLGSWGYEVSERWGTMSTADGTRVVPSAQGSLRGLLHELRRGSRRCRSPAGTGRRSGRHPGRSGRRPHQCRGPGRHSRIVKDRDICEHRDMCETLRHV